MGYTITDLTDNIRISDGVDNSWLFSKPSTVLYQFGDKVRIMQDQFRLEVNFIHVDNAGIDSGDDLYNLLDGYVKNGAASSTNAKTKENNLSLEGQRNILKAIYEQQLITNNLLKLILA